MRLGKGEKLDDIIASMNAVAEGVLTSKSSHDLARKKGIECPVIEGIYKARRAVPRCAALCSPCCTCCACCALRGGGPEASSSQVGKGRSAPCMGRKPLCLAMAGLWRGRHRLRVGAHPHLKGFGLTSAALPRCPAAGSPPPLHPSPQSTPALRPRPPAPAPALLPVCPGQVIHLGEDPVKVRRS